MFIFENPKHEWCKWDFRLMKALELQADMLQGNIPVYWDRSDRVRFEIESYISKSRAALDRAEEKAREGKDKNYGKVFYPVPKTIDGGPLPTRDEWLEEQAKKKAMSVGKIKFTNDPFDNAAWAPESP